MPAPATTAQPWATIARVIRRHWPMLTLLLFAVALRVMFVLAYRPILWYLSDSGVYLSAALDVQPAVDRPIGYSFLLALLEPTHRLASVAAVQHLLGLATGLLCYAVALRFGAPRWAATVAAAVVWFEGTLVGLEHVMLGETLVTALLAGGVALLVWPSGRPGPLRCVIVGLLLAYSVIIRPQGAAVVAAIALVLLVFRVGWWRVAIVVVSWLIPVLAYSGWYASYHENVGLSETGRFLYGKAMTFTDCELDLPPREQVLCAEPVPDPRPHINFYLWYPDSPLQQIEGRPEQSRVGGSFFRHAVTQQPVRYAANVAGTFLRYFGPTSDSQVFLPTQPPKSLAPVWEEAAKEYQDGRRGHTRVSEPASLLRDYQTLTRIPGLAYGLLIVLGLVALWRRRRDAATRNARMLIGLAVASALSLVGFASLTIEYLGRYRVSIVPLVLVAGAVAVGLVSSRRGPTSHVDGNDLGGHGSGQQVEDPSRRPDLAEQPLEGR